MERNGIAVSERKVAALVKVYDVWRETTQRQFVNGTFSNAAQKNRNGTSRSGTRYQPSLSRPRQRVHPEVAPQMEHELVGVHQRDCRLDSFRAGRNSLRARLVSMRGSILVGGYSSRGWASALVPSRPAPRSSSERSR